MLRLRSLSAASQSLASKPRLAVLSFFEEERDRAMRKLLVLAIRAEECHVKNPGETRGKFAPVLDSALSLCLCR